MQTLSESIVLAQAIAKSMRSAPTICPYCERVLSEENHTPTCATHLAHSILQRHRFLKDKPELSETDYVYFESTARPVYMNTKITIQPQQYTPPSVYKVPDLSLTEVNPSTLPHEVQDWLYRLQNWIYYYESAYDFGDYQLFKTPHAHITVLSRGVPSETVFSIEKIEPWKFNLYLNHERYLAFQKYYAGLYSE